MKGCRKYAYFIWMFNYTRTYSWICYLHWALYFVIFVFQLYHVSIIRLHVSFHVYLYNILVFMLTKLSRSSKPRKIWLHSKWNTTKWNVYFVLTLICLFTVCHFKREVGKFAQNSERGSRSLITGNVQTKFMSLGRGGVCVGLYRNSLSVQMSHKYNSSLMNEPIMMNFTQSKHTTWGCALRKISQWR